MKNKPISLLLGEIEYPDKEKMFWFHYMVNQKSTTSTKVKRVNLVL